MKVFHGKRSVLSSLVVEKHNSAGMHGARVAIDTLSRFQFRAPTVADFSLPSFLASFFFFFFFLTKKNPRDTTALVTRFFFLPTLCPIAVSTFVLDDCDRASHPRSLTDRIVART